MVWFTVHPLSIINQLAVLVSCVVTFLISIQKRLCVNKENHVIHIDILTSVLNSYQFSFQIQEFLGKLSGLCPLKETIMSWTKLWERITGVYLGQTAATLQWSVFWNEQKSANDKRKCPWLYMLVVVLQLKWTSYKLEEYFIQLYSVFDRFALLWSLKEQ